MAMPPFRRRSNIQRSFQTRVGNTVTTQAAVVVPVFWNRSLDDPDAASDDDGTPLDAWIECIWITQRAGRLGASIVQVDVYRRVEGAGDADSDLQGLEADDIADAFEDIWSGLDGDGGRLAYFNVLDYTADPATPPDTGECAIVGSLGGLIGEGDVPRATPPEGGFQRRTLRFTVRLVHDLAGSEAFYT